MSKYKVEATLRYGRNMPKYVVNLCIISIVLGCVMIILSIVCAIIYLEIDLLFVLFFPIIEIICIASLLKYMIIVKKEIALWIEDAYLLDGYCKRTAGSIEKLDGAINISITFEYNGVKMTKMSGSNSHNYNYVKDGYAKWFRKYENKRLKILYSPKYDEVMIIQVSE